MSGIIGKKLGMTSIFDKDGKYVACTVIEAGPCVVTQVKTVENDGYSAVQVGYVDKKEKIVTKDNSGKKSIAHRNGVTKAEKGHFDKAGVSGKRYVKNSDLRTLKSIHLLRKLKLISLQQETRLMQLLFQKVKVSRAQLSVTTRAEDL